MSRPALARGRTLALCAIVCQPSPVDLAPIVDSLRARADRERNRYERACLVAAVRYLTRTPPASVRLV